MKQRIYLCGAGISAPPPSSLPTVATFKAFLEEQINSVTNIDQILVKRSIHGDKEFATLRFEQIITCLLTIDKTLRSLDFIRIDVTRGRRFNEIHAYLAGRILVGETVITTNFDSLIEQAAINLYPSVLHDFPQRLSKVHGTAQVLKDNKLVDVSNETLKADIYAVASGNGITQVGGAVAETIRLIEGRDLVVLGYSFSDSFDVTPALMSVVPRTATIYDYSPGIVPEEIAIAESSYWEVVDLFNAWNKNGSLVRVLRGDFSLTLNERIGSRFPPSKEKPNIALPKFESSDLYYLVARLLFNQDDHLNAATLFEKVVEESTGNIRDESAYYQLRCTASFREIIDQGKTLVGQIEDERTLLATFIYILDAASFLGATGEFRSIYASFRSIAKSADNNVEVQRMLGRSYHCLANYFFYTGRFRFALVALHHAKLERTKTGEPIDIFYTEYAMLMCRVLLGELAIVRSALINLRKYSRKINDLASRECILTLEGLYLLLSGEGKKGGKRLRAAIAVGEIGTDNENMDLETLAYLFCAKYVAGVSDRELRNLIDDMRNIVSVENYKAFGLIVPDLAAFLKYGHEREFKSLFTAQLIELLHSIRPRTIN